MNCDGIVDVVLSYAVVVVVFDITVDRGVLADVWKIVVALVEGDAASGSELMVSRKRESCCYIVGVYINGKTSIIHLISNYCA